MTDSLFPLPLTPFELVMLWDDRPGYPMRFLLEAEFTGRFDRGLLEQALDVAIERHPLLGALVDTGAKGGPAWVSAAGRRPEVVWAEGAIPPLAEQGVDLRAQPGLRLWVHQADETARVLFEFHHACADGVGGLMFIGDLLAAYHQASRPGDTSAALVPLDPTLLRRRSVIEAAPVGTLPPPATWREKFDAAMGHTRRAMLNPTPVAAPPASPSGTSGIRWPAETYRLSTAELQRLRLQATAAAASLNDVLVARLFTTIITWNRRYGRLDDAAKLRVNVPANLRSAEQKLLPAANVMGYAFIDRRVGDCRDAAQLLNSIRQEARVNQQGRLARGYLDVIALLTRVPAAMRAFLRYKRSFSSVILSNGGEVTRPFTARLPRRDGRIVVGGVTLDNLTGVPPVRHGTRASLGVSLYGSSLSISALCDPKYFDSGATRAFLDCYIDELRRE